MVLRLCRRSWVVCLNWRTLCTVTNCGIRRWSGKEQEVGQWPEFIGLWAQGLLASGLFWNSAAIALQCQTWSQIVQIIYSRSGNIPPALVANAVGVLASQTKLQIAPATSALRNSLRWPILLWGCSLLCFSPNSLRNRKWVMLRDDPTMLLLLICRVTWVFICVEKCPGQ